MPAATDPPVIPMLNYADGAAALDWLVQAFGFIEQARNGFPARRYRCEDLEGHRWMFMQRS